VKTTIFYV